MNEITMSKINNLLREGYTPNEAFDMLGLLKQGESLSETDSDVILALFQMNEFVDSIKTQEQYEENKNKLDEMFNFLKSDKVQDYFSFSEEDMERE